MPHASWLRALRKRLGKTLSRRIRRNRRLLAERLEDRALLAAFAPGNSFDLIADINTANANGEADVIDLGGETFTLFSAADNGITGLPVIVADGGNPLTIVNGTIERAAGAPNFRILLVAAATLTLDGVTIRGGSVPFQKGGGIYNGGGGTLIVSHSVISGNLGFAGGGIYSNSGDVTIHNSTISGNTTSNPGSGGGIYSAGNLTISNSTLSGNTASNRGGGISNNGNVTISNSTLSGNTAGNVGGGINSFNMGAVTVNNSIFTGSTGGDLDGTANGGNNLSDDGTVPGTIGAVTGFDPVLRNNGGQTLTHALLPGSNAIDAGSNALAVDPGPDGMIGGGDDVPLVTDQRGPGFERIVDGGGGATVDIGAFEFGAVPVPDSFVVTIATDENDGTPDPAQGAGTSLREAISAANANPNQSLISFDPLLDGTPIVLSIGGSDEDNNATGDLDVLSEITIQGRGTQNTIIDAGGLGDRVFHSIGAAGFTLDGVTIRGGSVPNGSGGGVRNDNGVLVVGNSVISGNFALSGGGIANSGATTINGSIFSGNTAVEGGGVFNFDGTISIHNSTLSGNTAPLGGGIRNRGDVAIHNSTLSGNTSRLSGGGIYNLGNVTIHNSTLSGNTAPLGGGIRTSATVTINNSIVTGSTGGDLSGNAYGSNNLSDDGSVPGTLAAVTNFDSVLRDNGGPTFTHALLAGSNAIDAGDNSLIPAGVGTDQRGTGFPRIANGGTSVTVDVGAYEASRNAWITVTDSIDLTLPGIAFVVTVTVAPTFAGTPTGTVTLASDLDGSLGSMALPASGVVTFTGVVLNTSGLHQLVAAYAGDGTFDAVQSSDSHVVPVQVTIATDEDDGSIDPNQGTGTSLREAVSFANAHAPIAITFDPSLDGTPITLSLAGDLEDNNATGDLDILARMTIFGNGAANTIIDAGGPGGLGDRVFHVLRFGNLTINNSTISGGEAVEQGLFLNTGGGIDNRGRVTVNNSTISGNTAVEGGGVFNFDETISIHNSTLSGNAASGSGGGISTNTI
ncbi:MAG: Ig-like domain repeat protein [Planctomycetota bacterium]|nr:Ig-like domain repeat protein [Planctomycetota bacterium]